MSVDDRKLPQSEAWGHGAPWRSEPLDGLTRPTPISLDIAKWRQPHDMLPFPTADHVKVSH